MENTTDGFHNLQPNSRSRTGHNYKDVSNHGGQVQMGDIYYYNYEDPLSRLEFSKNARFNSEYRQHAQICHKDTRTELLRDIYNWVDGEDEQHIFWLQGLAGTGKSTIAQTVAKYYYDLNPKQLAASFFFARGGGDASHAGLFATSIAIQLAKYVPLLRDAICKAITKCSDIASLSLSEQWHQLVIQPFSSLEVTYSPSSYLIVIDALDECNGANDIQIIFQLLSEAQQLIPLRLRFLLTSRPDIVIRRGFQQMPITEHRDAILHEIKPAVVDHDIALYLKYKLGGIGLGSDWPTQCQVQQLVRRSSGLFIWAATACRYIGEGRNHANERLSKVLKNQAKDSAPEKALDAIYTMVLMNSVPENFDDEEKGTSYGLLSYILGSVVILFTPLTVHSLHLLLSISLDEITGTVMDLHSILHIAPKEKEDYELRLHHPSFRDYLVNPSRCDLESLQVDEKGAHRRLLMGCLSLMAATLKENICNLDYSNPGILLGEVEEKRIQQHIHPALRYACLYWVQHLQRSSEMIYDKDRVDNFMRQHLLAWIEALSWMERAAESIQAVTCLQSIASTNTCPLFCQYIQDVKRFISYTYPIVQRAPLQLYISALLFTPQNSHVRSHFQQRVFRWIKKLPLIEKNWSSLLRTLEGHSSSVIAIAFSPDGTMLASASNDTTIRLWDMATGSTCRILDGHTDKVIAIVFSSDGTMLASASNDCTVRLWNISTGNIDQTFNDDTIRLAAITFSPDGIFLASAKNYDNTVRLWNISTGNIDQTFYDDTIWLTAITFSPDGALLALASHDGTVRLWNTATGRTCQTFKGHTNQVDAIAFSPNGKMLASASYDAVRLWNTVTGETCQTFKDHTHQVDAITFSPDGTILAASESGTVRFWNTVTGKTCQTFKHHTHKIKAIAFSPDGTELVSASANGTIWLWDTVKRSQHQTFRNHTGCVTAITFSLDGAMLALAFYNNTIQLWNTVARSVRQTFKGHKDYIRAITFSPDGTLLASASRDGTIRLWNTATGTARQVFKVYHAYAVRFLPDGTLLASSPYMPTVRLWEMATGSLHHAFDGHPGFVTASGSDGTINLNSYYIASSFQQQHTNPVVVIKIPWITCNGCNVLWLPPEYRSDVFAIHETNIAIGLSSGQVLLFELNVF